MRDEKGKFVAGSKRNSPSEETRKKMSEAQKGKKLPQHQIEQMRERFKGKPLSEEHKAKLRVPKTLTEEQRKVISERSKNRKHTPEAKEKNRIASTGRIASLETRRKLSEGQKGEKGSNWKGGIYVNQQADRKNYQTKEWRRQVYDRDKFTCQKTLIAGGKLHPHHIINFADSPTLRYELYNGITLSEEAHKEFHTVYGYHNNTLYQLEEFLDHQLPTEQRINLVAYETANFIQDGVI